jgi:hypothetical protein
MSWSWLGSDDVDDDEGNEGQNEMVLQWMK